MIDPEMLDTAIGIYNRYRGSMATAELDNIDDTGFDVRFTGPFCRMCCDYDYFEDLRWELHALGIPASTMQIEDIEYLGDETFRVRYHADASG